LSGLKPRRESLASSVEEKPGTHSKVSMNASDVDHTRDLKFASVVNMVFHEANFIVMAMIWKIT